MARKKRGGNPTRARKPTTKRKRKTPYGKRVKDAAKLAAGLYFGRKMLKDYQYAKRQYQPLQQVESDIIEGVKAQMRKIPVKEIKRRTKDAALRGYERLRFRKNGRRPMDI